jgi:hypothetical protein
MAKKRCKVVRIERVPHSELAMHMRVAGQPAVIIGHSKYNYVIAKVRDIDGKEWITTGFDTELAPPRYREEIKKKTRRVNTMSEQYQLEQECGDVEIEGGVN